jgi:hypothetical protein
VQLWLQLSRGAKGVLWFIGFDEAEFRRYYTEARNIPALRAMPEAERAQVVEQLVAHGREAFEEQTRLNRFLQPLRDALLSMEWRPNGVRVLTASNPRRLDAALLVGARAAAIWLTNLDYAMHPQGYRFREQRAIELEVCLPVWLKPKQARLLAPNTEPRTLLIERGGETIRPRIDALQQQVGLIWVES